MRKWISAMIVSLGLPLLMGLGVVAVGTVIAPSKAEARCYTTRVRNCYYRYGRRYCTYRTRTRCRRARRCYWRRTRVRRRYCRTRYRYGRRFRSCYWRTYYQRRRVCY